MFNFNSIRLFIFIILTGLSIQVVAAPKVLVSVPALHSLVSGLMDGIAKPQLIIDDPDAGYDATLTGSQLRMLANADMIIWSGPGLEKGLQNAVDNKAPMARNKLLPLSALVPLLANDQQHSTNHANYRKVARNLEFWNDPRLSIIAIRTLTPRLVRLDPDNTELYLDNEIALLKRLRKIEQDMSNAAAILPVDATGIISDSNSYFNYRMRYPILAATGIMHSNTVATTGCRDHSFKKVATNTDSHSPGFQSIETTGFGTDFYFSMMKKEIEKLLANNCSTSI